MLLSLTPEAPFPTILFTLTFPSPLPESLPLPTAWASHLHIVDNLQISAPPDLHALDKSTAWVSLIDNVNFDLGTLTLTCTFIDHSKEEWPLSSSCVLLLEKVISDVNRSAREAESEAEDRSTSGESPFNTVSASAERIVPSASASSVTNANRPTPAVESAVVTVKTPKPKKRRSILAALVASFVLPSSRSTTPTSTGSPSPNGQLPFSPSDGSLRGSPTISASTSTSSQNEVAAPEPEIITPPPGVPISRFLRRRARSTLVDAFRRFVLPELGMRYRSELAKVNPHVKLPLGGPFYALWATRSMMRSVVAEMGRVLMGPSRGGSDTTSSTSSSPLETPIGPLGDPLDDCCTTTDESSVHSIPPDQTGANSKPSSLPSTLPLALKRKISPELSPEAYDAYTNLRETYAKLRSLSSQLEAHVQAESHIECVGSDSGSDSGSGSGDENNPFADFFDPVCSSSSSPDESFSRRQPQPQPHEQLTSVEIKSRRRAWSTRTYLVSGWETYRGSNCSQRISLGGHKRSYSEPAPTTLRGGSPMSLIGLSTPSRPSPLSQVWVRESEQDSLLADGDVDVDVGSAGRAKSRWGWSFEGGIGIGRRQREGGASRSGHRRERCVSMIAPSLSWKSGSKSKAREGPPSCFEDDYTGIGSGSRTRVVRKDVDEDAGNLEGDDYEVDVDVDIHQVDYQTEANVNVGVEKLRIGDDGTRSGRSNFDKGGVTRTTIHGFRSSSSVNHYPVLSSSDNNNTMDDHFDFHSYDSHDSGSRALRRFRCGYGLGANFLPAEGGFREDDGFDHDADDDDDDDDSEDDPEYGYSRSGPTFGGDSDKDSDITESSLYKKPSLEEFILPHPRPRVNSGLDIAHVLVR